MKNLSYLIILIGLIGNCQSGKVLCTPHQNQAYSKDKFDNISGTEIKKNLQDFHKIAYSSGRSLHLCSKSLASIGSNPKKSESFLGYFFRIEAKTSVIRNKDYLLS